MTSHRHPTLERVVRRLKSSAESFAAAAVDRGLMLQLAATPGAVRGRRLQNAAVVPGDRCERVPTSDG